jgi:hypothetical protein
MNRKKLVRIGSIVALGVVAVIAIGAFTGAGRDSRTSLEGAGEIAVDGGDDIAQSIDRALGRESSAPQPAAAPPVLSAPPIPADKDATSRSTGGASGTLVRPDQPVTGPTDPLALTADRKIVQTATISLQVSQVGGSFEEVSRIATIAGGFIASSKFALQGDDQIASMTIRVPAASYQDVLNDLRGLGVKVDSEGSNASDVTEEYSDLEARLRNLEATEARLLELMGRATNVNEILQVQDRLNGVRGEIERVLGRISLLDKLTDLATITVHLRPVVGGSGGTNGGFDFGAEVSKAWDESLEFLGDVAAGVISVVVFVWWAPLVALPLWFVGSRLLRGRPRPVSAMD